MKLGTQMQGMRDQEREIDARGNYKDHDFSDCTFLKFYEIIVECRKQQLAS